MNSQAASLTPMMAVKTDAHSCKFGRYSKRPLRSRPTNPVCQARSKLDGHMYSLQGCLLPGAAQIFASSSIRRRRPTTKLAGVSLRPAVIVSGPLSSPEYGGHAAPAPSERIFTPLVGPGSQFGLGAGPSQSSCRGPRNRGPASPKGGAGMAAGRE